jgi:chromosome segregation ATPase
MIDYVDAVGGAAGLSLVTGAVTRWLTQRSIERRDNATIFLERIAKLEGRCDEMSRAVICSQQELATERVRYATDVGALRARVEHLEEQVRELEKERDAARREADDLRRRKTPAPEASGG